MLKYVTVIFLSICCMACSKKSGLQTEQGMKWISFEELNRLQKSEPRKVVIDVYTDWCGWCKVMDKNTFQNASIAKYTNKKFYCVKLNAESADKLLYQGDVLSNAELASKWGIYSYPTTVYLDESLQPMTAPVGGYLDTVVFNKIIHYFGENAYKSVAFDKFELKNNK